MKHLKTCWVIFYFIFKSPESTEFYTQAENIIQ